MPSLRELQRAFTQGMLESPTSDILQHIRPAGFAPERHFQIYRNNVYENLTNALRDVYPVVERLVGEGFFRYAAATFIPAHLPQGGNLHDFGADFPQFLAEFPPARELPYLPDVARLEWSWHRSFHAADAAPLALEALAQLPPEDYGRLHFRLAPSATVLASDYPIHRIWEVNQPNHVGDDTVQLDQGGARLLVIRRTEVEIELLSDAEFALLSGCTQGKSLAAAAEAALHAQADFDLTGCLVRHVQQGTFIQVDVR